MNAPTPNMKIYGYFYTIPILLIFFLSTLCIVWSTFAEVTGSSAEAVGPDPEVFRYIEQLGDPDPSVQQAAVMALANASDSDSSDSSDSNVSLILEALQQGNLFIWESPDGQRRIVIAGEESDQNGQIVRPLFLAYGKQEITSKDGTPLYVPLEALQSINIDRRIRKAIKDLPGLFSADVQLRKSTAINLGRQGIREMVPQLQKALVTEKDRWTKYAIEEAINLIRLSDPEPLVRAKAAVELGRIHSSNALPVLKGMLDPEDGAVGEEDEPVKKAIANGISQIERRQFFTKVILTFWNGLSLASILLIIALGLGITFGLMKVINMAHGELMLIGAYTAYVMQHLFQKHLPVLFNSYFLFAIPFSFMVAGLLGILIELSVIRLLYGRPLDTLLATWGISLVIQQAVRHAFGAANVDVISPTWLRGGVQVTPDMVFPYNRLFILTLSLVCVLGLYFVLLRSPAGLKIRAVMQNRDMSSCLGISTRNVDRWTFAFGSGLAGMAGCALSQLGNVGPDLGQTYIVDSFMVVVLGGVGKLAGTILGAGLIAGGNKVLETLTNSPVGGKILILLFLILFLQKSPSGIFPAKGRQQE